MAKFAKANASCEKFEIIKKKMLTAIEERADQISEGEAAAATELLLNAQWRDYFPLIYVILRDKVDGTLCRDGKPRVSPQRHGVKGDKEWTIDELQSGEFDWIGTRPL
jgi:hypothetical protein